MTEKKDSHIAQPSLLDDPMDGSPAPEPVRDPPPAIGDLVTNHQNLMYMLAAGLLMPPSGFGNKHYEDSLGVFPGWLPLFIREGRKAAQPPRGVFEQVTSEAEHLLPVVLEVDLAGLQGPVRVLGPDGWREREFEQGVGPDEWLMLIPAPLPVSRVRRILFRELADRRRALEEAVERRNVPLVVSMCHKMSTPFQGTAALPWPPPDGPAERNVSLAPAQAAGGVLAVLHHLANCGDLAVRAGAAAFDPDADSRRDPAVDDPILGELPGWMRSGKAAEADDPPGSGASLFWRTVERLVDHREQSSDLRAEDVLLRSLRESSEEMADERWREAAQGLIRTLEAIGGGLGGGTISEMLEEHTKPLSRAAILFFLRRTSDELMELFDSKACERLEERDRLAAAILFGVRDGWLGMPLALRGTPGVAPAVTHRMAALAHRLDGSGFALGEPPERLRSLRERFQAEEWGSRERNAALALTRALKWPCIRSRLSLAKGTYSMTIEGGRAHFEFAGEAPVETWVDRADLLDRLARSRIDPKLEARVRNTLDG